MRALIRLINDELSEMRWKQYMATSAYCIGSMLAKEYPIPPFTFFPEAEKKDERTADDIRQQMKKRLTK